MKLPEENNIFKWIKTILLLLAPLAIYIAASNINHSSSNLFAQDESEEEFFDTGEKDDDDFEDEEIESDEDEFAEETEDDYDELGDPIEDENVEVEEDVDEEEFEDDDSFANNEEEERDPNVEPEIEVNAFPLTTIRRSKSGRVYLFEDMEGGIVQERNVFLLRKGATNVMAFRALKLYPDLAQFSARHVRKYPNYDILQPGQKFMAIDKIGEFYPEPTPEEQAQDEEDLEDIEEQMETNNPPVEDLEMDVDAEVDSEEDLEDETDELAEDDEIEIEEEDEELDQAELEDDESDIPDNEIEDLAGMDPPDIKAYDEDLDAGSSPEPGTSLSKDDFVRQEIELANLVVDEIPQLEKDRNWFSLGFGYFSVATLTNSTAFFSGLGLRYGYSIGDHLFVYNKRLQDSFTLELSAFLYTVTGFESSTDTYTVAPIVGSARYNLYLGQSFIAFVYAGLVKNLVLSSSGGSDASVDSLSSFGPAFGAGMFIHIGPKWYIRFEAGLDFIGSGLVLKI